MPVPESSDDYVIVWHDASDLTGKLRREECSASTKPTHEEAKDYLVIVTDSTEDNIRVDSVREVED